MIKSGGENIYPAEIEQIIMLDERVDEVVVVKRPDDKWGEVPVAFVAVKDKSLREEHLAVLCAEYLSKFKRPNYYVFISSSDIPRSTTGKVQRHLLEKMI
jgi:fatty-acyl-CoA synthase